MRETIVFFVEGGGGGGGGGQFSEWSIKNTFGFALDLQKYIWIYDRRTKPHRVSRYYIFLIKPLITLIIGPSKESKKYSIIMLKNVENTKKPLRITLIMGLKSQKSAR